MDAAAVQVIVDAAVAAAIALQANNMPVPPVPPVVGAFSLTPGVVNMLAPWDYSTSEGIKLFFQSTAAVKPSYDGTETSLKMFLKAISAKAKTWLGQFHPQSRRRQRKCKGSSQALRCTHDREREGEGDYIHWNGYEGCTILSATRDVLVRIDRRKYIAEAASQGK